MGPQVALLDSHTVPIHGFGPLLGLVKEIEMHDW